MIRILRAVTVVSVLLAGGAAQAKTVLDTLGDAGTFSILLAAVKSAGLADVLNGPGPYTLFAPTDDAFSKLPKGSIEALVKPENKERAKALVNNHIVAGAILARDVAGKRLETTTLQGNDLVIDATRGLTIENAKITPGMTADNGIIHVIDTVLVPK